MYERVTPPFADPAFKTEYEAIVRTERVASDTYKEGRKALVARKAGKGLADSEYHLSLASRRQAPTPQVFGT